jgi:hypothetical protein
VLCNARAVKAGDGTYSTAAGQPLAGDVTYMTCGAKPNTAFLRGSSIPLDDGNQIQVGSRFLRWPGLILLPALPSILQRVATTCVRSNSCSAQQALIPLFQVDQYLRVVGHQRVFAVGDATDVRETKLGYLAKAQVLP